MYLPIGMNKYLWSERIIGIFQVALLHESHSVQPFLATARIVSQKLPYEEAKAVILTDTNELYLSKVNCRTLKQRWKRRGRKFP